jgi:hypothetical protein
VPGAWRPVKPQPILFEKRNEGTAGEAVVAGAFYNLGYGEMKIAVTHLRLIFFFPDLQAWALCDAVDGAGVHEIESRFQFAPGPLQADGFFVQTGFEDANLMIHGRDLDWTSLRIAEGGEAPREGWFSESFNKIEPAPCAVFCSGPRALPWQSVMALVPSRGTQVDSQIAEACWQRAQSQSDPLFQQLRAML